MNLKSYTGFLWTVSIVLTFQRVCSLSDNDTRVYLFAFMNITSDDPTLPHYQSIHFGASISSRYRLEIPVVGVDSYYQLTPKSIVNPQFAERDWVFDLSDSINTDTTFNAIRVVANNKIDIFASKATRGSTDGFLALPLTAESTEFFIPSFINVPQGHSSFLVVSTFHDTCVEANMIKGGKTQRLFFKALDEFEVFQSYSMDDDFTGVYINSTRPVAVFGGHECAQVPKSVVFCDHLIEQIPPLSEWGTEAIAGPIIGRDRTAGYIIRVLSMDDTTNIFIYSQSNVLLSSATSVARGGYHEFLVPFSDQAAFVTCTIKCLAVQYNTGFFQATANTDTKTDPYMTVLPPIDHYTNFMTFSTDYFWSVNGLRPFISYVAVVARTVATSGVLLNDKTIASSWTQVQGTAYSVTSLFIDHDNYTLYHPDPNELFVGYLYGHSDRDPTAYGYPTGYKIKGSPIPGDWWEEFFVTQAPTQSCTAARTAPPDSIRAPDNVFNVRAFLKFEAVTADCLQKYKIMLTRKIPDLKELINFLICVGDLCPNTEYAHVSNLTLTGYIPDGSTNTIESFDIEVALIASLDETIRDILICKRQVTAFLREPHNWNMPTDIVNCPQLDLNDLVPLSQQYQCPIA